MKKNKLIFILEYIPLRIVVAIIDMIPTIRALRFGKFLGKLAWSAQPGRAKRAWKNVIIAGITTDEKEAKRIAKLSFESFGIATAEALKAMLEVTADQLAREVEWDADPEALRLIKEEGTPVILASAHLGCWEVAGNVASFYKPIVAVARMMNNPYAQRLLASRNPRARLVIVEKHAADRLALLRPLRNGSLLGLICDQHAHGSGSIVVPFMGHPARTAVSPARLSLATGIPIVVANCIRRGDMKFLIRLQAPMYPNRDAPRDAEIERITTEINKRLERDIRDNPEQYLWAHRRWRKEDGANV